MARDTSGEFSFSFSGEARQDFAKPADCRWHVELLLGLKFDAFRVQLYE